MCQSKSSSSFTSDYKVRRRVYSLGVCSFGSAVSQGNKGQSQRMTKAILSGNFFCLTAKQLKFHGTTGIELLLGYPHSCWTHPHTIIASQYKLIKASLLKVIFCAEPHPPHLSVQAFCPLMLCFFTCWSLHIFSSLAAPAFCRKGGRSRRAATANSISQTGWGVWTKQISIFWRVGSLSPPWL